MCPPDISDWLNSVKDQVQSAVTQYTPVVEAAALQYAQDNISQQQAAVQPAANAAIAKTVNTSSPKGSLGAAFSSVFGQGAIAAKGPQMLLMVAVIGVVGYLLLRRGE